MLVCAVLVGAFAFPTSEVLIDLLNVTVRCVVSLELDRVVPSTTVGPTYLFVLNSKFRT